MRKYFFTFAALALVALPSAGFSAAEPAPAHNIEQIVKDIRAAGESDHAKMRDLLQEREALLVAEKFDADAYLRLSREIERASAAKYDEKNKILIDSAKTMSQEERSQLNAALRGRYAKKAN